MIHASQIANLFPCETIGTLDRLVSHPIPFITGLNDARGITWCSERNAHLLPSVKNAVVICGPLSDGTPANPGVTLLSTPRPRLAFAKVLAQFFEDPHRRFIHPSVVMDGYVECGENVQVGPHTYIHSATILGDNVTIGANCTIGGPGFGYEKDEDGAYIRMPHMGGVLIEDNVEIGNNVCIDRAVLGSTRIGQGARIDNLVHIAHNVTVGKNAIIIAHAMIGGSAQIGEGAWIAPSATIRNGITVGANAIVGLAANVVKNVPDGVTVMGNPAKPK